MKKPTRTLEQLRSAYAWRAVSAAKQRQGDKFKEYRSLVKKLPALIANNGLGQALAFLAANADVQNNQVADTKVAGLVFNHLVGWLHHSEDAYRGPYAGQPPAVLGPVQQGTSQQYVHARLEALAVLTYLRLFTDALKGKDGAA